MKAKKPKEKTFEVGPASEAQAIFVNSDTDITIASGSAGSSKSYGILIRFLRYVNDPHTTGIIFRRTSTQLNAPGGLWNEAINLYTQIDPGLRIRTRDSELRFSNGAILKFSHFEDEKSKVKFKGLQASFIGFDEASEFTEEMVTYLLSRLRNFNVKYKPTMCLATNPDYDSFLREWVEWWLDPITGIPDPKKRGMVRCFVRQNSKMIWGSREELQEQFGNNPNVGITSVCVVGSTCYDNPFLLKADPSYPARLKALSRVEMERLLYGSWYARQEESGYFKREWIEEDLCPPERVIKRVRAWDFAASLPSEANPNPDWTVGVRMSKDIHSYYIVEDVVRFRERVFKVEETVFEVAEQDGRDTVIILPVDPGHAGKAYARGLAQRLMDRGFTVRLKTTNKSKLERFKGFASAAESRFVRVVKADWNKDYYTELEAFDGGSRTKKDDQADATSDAFWGLKQTVEIPTIAMPDLSAVNPFG